MSIVMTMNDRLGMSKEVDVDILLPSNRNLPSDRNTQLRRGRRETVADAFGDAKHRFASPKASATVHDDTHGALVTLYPYTSTREDEARQLGSSPKPCRVGL
jgi:hypothetical protein